MKLALAGDSIGEYLARVLANHFQTTHEVLGVSHSTEGLGRFYADISDRVANGFLDKIYDLAILIYGTGIGVCISADNVSGIRAALTQDTSSAQRAALSNQAQFITIGSWVGGPELAKAVATAYPNEAFEDGPKCAGNVRAINAVGAKYHVSPPS